MKSFGQRLENLRDSYGYTKKEVSFKLGFTANVYGSYERGERRPTLETLIKLADMFDTSLDYLIRGEHLNGVGIDSTAFDQVIIKTLKKYDITDFSLLDADKWNVLSEQDIHDIDHHFKWVVKKAVQTKNNI